MLHINRQKSRFVVLSWGLFLLLVGVVTFGVYDSAWVVTTREPNPLSVRFELIGLVFVSALSVNLLSRLRRSLYRSREARALLSGLFVALTVFWIAESSANRHLGGNAVGTPDYSGLYLLMYEGWGMMLPFLAVGFGFLAAVREGFERP